MDWLTLKRPPGVKYDPNLRFFSPDTFYGVPYNDTNLHDCHDRCPLGWHSGFVLLVITVFLKISIFPIWGQI